MPRSRTEKSRIKLAWISVAGIGLFYLVLVIGILPPRSFFSGDAGVKYLQVHNLINSQWRTLSIDYPGEELDLDHRYSPFTTTNFFYEKDQKTYGVYSELFIVAVSVFYALFGFYGLYVVPILATLGTMMVTYHLSTRFSERFAPLAPIIVGLCTPMLLYSLDLWEHTLAVFFSTLSVLLLLDGIRSPDTKRLFASGLALAISIWIREELYLMILAELLVLIWVKRTQCVHTIFVYGAGLAALFIPLWAYKWIQSGNLLGAHVDNVVVKTVTGAVVRRADYNPIIWLLQQRLLAAGLVIPWVSERWILVVILVFLGRAILWLVSSSRWRRILLSGLAIGMALSIGCEISLDVIHQWRPESLAQSFPLVFFLAFLGTVSVPSFELNTLKRRDAWSLSLIVAAFIGGVCSTTPSLGGTQWGPRFLMATYPLLTVLIVYTLQQFSTRSLYRTLPGAAILSVFVLLLLCSIVVQVESVQQLRAHKMYGQRLIVATEQVEQDVIVTDLWWFPQVIAPIFDQKPLFLVDHGRNGTLAELLAHLHQNDVQSFTFVTTPDSLQTQAQNLAVGRWVEQTRRTEQIWLEVDFITYEYDEPANHTMLDSRQGRPCGRTVKERNAYDVYQRGLSTDAE